MKPLPPGLAPWRVAGFGYDGGDERNGCLSGVPLPSGAHAVIIFSNGGGWDHVSMSLRDRCPTWDEMSWLKDQFFYPTQTVIQYHPDKSRYKNVHPYCLHLWRPHFIEVPMPPIAFV